MISLFVLWVKLVDDGCPVTEGADWGSRASLSGSPACRTLV